MSPRNARVPVSKPATRRLYLEALEARDVPATITVSSAADTGPNTLRAAITASNASTGVLDTIAFALPAGSRSIALTAALPDVTDPVVIDGTTQSGYAGSPLVELLGTNAGAVNGLNITAGGSTVRGLSVTGFNTSDFAAGFSPAGIRVTGGASVIEGNWIGLRPDGSSRANTNGVWLLSSGNRVGGATPAARNVISTNNDGVRVGDVTGTADGNEILGNYIGTTPTGNAVFTSTPTDPASVFGFTGVVLVNANNTVIGRPGAGNVITSGGGHYDGAIEVIGSSNGTVIQSNLLGLAADGTTVLGNSGPGVAFSDDVLAGTLVSNLVGGTGAGEGNRIAGNSVGVFVRADTSSNSFYGPRATRGVSILGNSIYGNLTGGISLGTGGSAAFPANDAGDADSGANGLQNFPVITGVTRGATTTTVNGTLNSRPNTTYRVEFFASAQTGPNGYGEGRTFLGFTTVATDGSGNAAFSAALAGVVPAVQPITATATAPDGSTSAFSLATHGLVVAPPVRVNQFQSLETTEAGGTLTFTVALLVQPTADVTVTPVSSDTTEVTVGAALTFTALNWNVPQSITVTGVDDTINDGNIPFAISLTTSSADPRYQGFTAPGFQAVNADNDTIITSGFVQTSEAGPAGQSFVSNTFTVRLGRAPAADVTVTFPGVDATEHTLSAPSLTFTTANWNIDQTVTVTGVDDAIPDGAISYNVTPTAASTDATFNGLTGEPLFLTNQDDDLIVLSTSAVTIAEGGPSTTFTVRLAKAPTQPVTVYSSYSPHASFSPQFLTFDATNWNVPQTITVSEYPFDTVPQGSQPTQVLFSMFSSDLAFSATELLTVTVIDNDPGVVAQLDAPAGTQGVTTEANGTARVLVFLATQPTADVTVSVASSDTTEGTVSVSSLTFTQANWNTPQVVTVTGANDGLKDGDIVYTVTFGPPASTDNAYNGGVAPTVTLTNQDDDPGLRYAAQFLSSTSESGGGTSFTIALTAAPTANVVVPLSSSDITEGTVAPASLTFTPSNWNVPQTVGVTGVDDTDVDGTIAYNVVVGTLQSADARYNGLNPAGGVRPFTNADDDGTSTQAAIVVSQLSGQTTEAGGTFTFGVSLSAAPTTFSGTATVTIPFASSNTAEGTVSPASLTFDATNWSTPQMVTVTGVADGVADGNRYFRVLLGPATGNNSNYSGRSGPDVIVLNADTNAGVVVAPRALATTEAGGTGTFTVALTSAPTADVTIPLSSSNIAEGTVSPASLTFTALNWNVPQTVTVTGVDDAADDGDKAYTILLGAATSADLDYNGINPADVTVTNADNDDPPPPPAVIVTPVTGLTTTEAGGTATFKVRLATVPTADVTVTITSGDLTEGTVGASGPLTLTFTPANALTDQTVTVTGVDDALDDGDQAYTIVTAPAVSTDANYNGLNPADVAVTNTDNDTAGVTVTPVTGLTTTEAGGTATFTVRLNSQPTADVTIALSSSNTAEGTVSPASLTFTPANWNAPQTVTVTGVDDAADDGDIGYVIATGIAVSTDAAYSGINPADVAVTNADNDGPPTTPTPPTTNPPVPPTGVGTGAPVPPGLTAGRPGEIVVFDPRTGARLGSAAPFAGYAGRLVGAAGDVNGDGVADYVVATGAGARAHLKVLSGSNGTELFSFLPFGRDFFGGLSVAVVDVTGDGKADIVVGAGAGSNGGHVKVFDGATGAEVRSFLSFLNFAGGVNVAARDVDGDGDVDLVVATATGAAHVKTFDGTTGGLLASYLPFDGYTGGLQVAVIDLNADGVGELVVGSATGPAHVKVFDGRTNALLFSFLAFTDAAARGARPVAVDATGDGDGDILVFTGDGRSRVFDGRTLGLDPGFGQPGV